jgi:hypothetical protein
MISPLVLAAALAGFANALPASPSEWKQDDWNHGNDWNKGNDWHKGKDWNKGNDWNDWNKGKDWNKGNDWNHGDLQNILSDCHGRVQALQVKFKALVTANAKVSVDVFKPCMSELQHVIVEVCARIQAIVDVNVSVEECGELFVSLWAVSLPLNFVFMINAQLASSA